MAEEWWMSSLFTEDFFLVPLGQSDATPFLASNDLVDAASVLINVCDTSSWEAAAAAPPLRAHAPDRHTPSKCAHACAPCAEVAKAVERIMAATRAAEGGVLPAELSVAKQAIDAAAVTVEAFGGARLYPHNRTVNISAPFILRVEAGGRTVRVRLVKNKVRDFVEVAM